MIIYIEKIIVIYIKEYMIYLLFMSVTPVISIERYFLFMVSVFHINVRL